MKLWIDDVRPAPEGYYWVICVNDAKTIIQVAEDRYAFNLKYFYGENKKHTLPIELIDIDHDAGDYAHLGGDYIKLLDWLEETGRNYPIHIHSVNVVGRINMEAICRRNGWKIVE